MKIGVASDAHANLQALEGVFRKLGRIGVERVSICGDVVGDRTNPNRCTTVLVEGGVIGVASNHDRAAIEKKTLGCSGM